MTLKTFHYVSTDAPHPLRHLIRVAQAESRSLFPVIFHGRNQREAEARAKAWWKNAASGHVAFHFHPLDVADVEVDFVADPVVETPVLADDVSDLL